MQWDQECPPLTAVQEDTVVVVAPLLGGKGDLDVQVQTGVEAALEGAQHRDRWGGVRAGVMAEGVPS